MNTALQDFRDLVAGRPGPPPPADRLDALGRLLAEEEEARVAELEDAGPAWTWDAWTDGVRAALGPAPVDAS